MKTNNFKLFFILIILSNFIFAQKWELLISPNSYDTTKLNFSNTAYNQNENLFYSVYKIGSTVKIQVFDLNNNSVNTLSTWNLPQIDLNTLTYDYTNNRLISNRAGRENIYAVSAKGGSWYKIGNGIIDYESYGANFFWNSSKNKVGFFGGYGIAETKNWIWENNGANWTNSYQNNSLCNNITPSKRVGGITIDAPGSNRIFLFSGQGNCDGKQRSESCSLGSAWATDIGIYCWLKDLWQLDLNTLSFKNILPLNSSSITQEGQIVYDYIDSTFFIVGGFIPSPVYYSDYGYLNDYEVNVLRYRVGVDEGFLPIKIEGKAPPTTKINNSGPMSTFYDAINNQIIWARKDGIWAIKLLNNCKANITPKIDTSICEGDFLNLKATKGLNYKYEWFLNGKLINDEYNNEYDATKSGLYSLRVKYGACIDSSNVISISVNKLPSSIVKISDSSNFCEGATLTVLDSGTYLWSNGETSKSINIFQSGSYSVRISSNGCFSNSEEIFIYSKPTITGGKDTAVCFNSYLTLKGFGAANYSWDNNIKNDVSFKVTNDKLYTVIGTDNNGCKDTATVNVLVYPQPSVQIFNNNSGIICQGTPFTLSSSTNNASYFQWKLNGNNLSGATNNTLISKNAGNYSLEVQSVNGCKEISAPITIQTQQLTYINAGSDQKICLGDRIKLNATCQTLVDWGKNLKNGDVVSPTKDTLMIASTTDQNGCQNADTLNVKVNYPSNSIVNTTSFGSFELNGVLYDKSGQYIQTIKNSYGCDSTITLNLVVENLGVNGNLGVNENEIEGIKVYPNPTYDGIIQIESIYDINSIKLYNSDGKLLESLKDKTIDLSRFGRGVYFMVFIDSNSRPFDYKIVY